MGQHLIGHISEAFGSFRNELRLPRQRAFHGDQSMKSKFECDWTDAASYPSASSGNVTIEAWAWEFLRRSEKYRSSFERNIRKHWPDIEIQDAPDADFGEQMIAGWNLVGCKEELQNFARTWSFGAYFGTSPKIALPETPSSLNSITGNVDPPVLFDTSVPVWVFESEDLQADGEDEPDACPRGKLVGRVHPGSLAWFRIDFSRPIDRQLDAIRRLSMGIQARLIRDGMSNPMSRARPQLGKFTEYLRVLDAREAGAPNKLIASIIFPKLKNEYPSYSGLKRVDSHHRTASEIRDGGWRDFLSN
jgi:hypothetical protein